MSINNYKVVAIIIARLSSSRLLGKHFKLLLNKPLIQWTLDELRRSKYINEIVIATTDRSEDDRLCDVAEKNNIDCYRYGGDIDEVTKMVRMAAETYKAELVISISGDCPLIYSPTIDRMIENLSNEKADVCNISEKNGQKCIHEGIGVMTLNAWRKADDLSNKAFYQEHPGSYVKDHAGEFTICTVTDDDIFYEINHRISIDTPADVEFMNRAFSILDGKGKDVKLPNLISLLKERPELMEINRHVYQKKINDNSIKILFRADGGEGIGIGHIAREVTIAKRLIESYGAGVRFLVNNDKSIKDKLSGEGLSFHTLPEGINREEEIDIIENIYKQFALNTIILDLNGDISVEYMNSLKALNVPVVSLDNATEGACLADVNIFPVAHYDPHVLDHCSAVGQVYGGAEYVVINDKLHKPAKEKKTSPGKTLRVLITFGGSDPHNLTEKVAKALITPDLPVKLDVVIGPAFRATGKLEELSEKYKDRITCHKGIDNLAGLMTEVDIAFTAVGITVYELAYMGVPSVIISNYRADEQCLKSLRRMGISIPLGYREDVTAGDIRQAMAEISKDINTLQRMSMKCSQLIDGRGTERIADIISKMKTEVNYAKESIKKQIQGESQTVMFRRHDGVNFILDILNIDFKLKTIKIHVNKMGPEK